MLRLREPKHNGVRVQALSLLSTFLLVGVSSHLIIQEVEALVTDLFPSVSGKMKRGSAEAREYARQLRELLLACIDVARRGEPKLLTKVCSRHSRFSEPTVHIFGIDLLIQSSLS